MMRASHRRDRWPRASKISEQALLAYKAILDQFAIIKKQQWATTNYAVLIYAAIAWLAYHVDRSPVFSWVLIAVASIVGLAATGLLISFQVDLRDLRKQAQTAENEFFSNEERKALGMKDLKHPFLRGWEVLTALIAVCLFGAGLLIAAVVVGPGDWVLVDH
jgi:hypothetical protein